MPSKASHIVTLGPGGRVGTGRREHLFIDSGLLGGRLGVRQRLVFGWIQHLATEALGNVING